MKIPIYQTQVPYQRAVARSVTLAAPIPEYVQMKAQKGWMKAGELLDKKERLDKKAAEEERKRQAALQAARPPAVPSKGTRDYPPNHPEKIMLREMDFSNPMRKALLDFSRAQTQPEGAFSNGATAASSIDKLDEYVSSQVPHEQTLEPTLWKDDYVILRQEMKHLQAQQARQQAQENFEQGASSFVQTAALVRSPKALESYIQNNLSAAGAEAAQQGTAPQAWAQQKECLYRQAVSHNIESALMSGEVENAQAMYKHFQEKLPTDTQQLLSAKLQEKQADTLAQQMCQALPDAVSTQDANTLAQQIHQQYGDSAFGKQIQQAADVHLQKRSQEDWSRRATIYQSCFAATPSGNMSVKTPAELEEITRLRQAAVQDTQTQSSPAVFNRMYEEIAQGKGDWSSIGQAFENKEITAADCARLKQAYCLRQAQKQDPKAALVPLAVSRLCRDCQLTDAEREQTYYFVFSAGNSAQEQLQAAREVKQMLLLQEKNK